MENQYARYEKTFWEWCGRIGAFILGLFMMLLPEKLPNVTFGQKLAYEPIGVALCLLSMLFIVTRIIRACSWMEEKKTNPLRYAGIGPKIKVG